MKELFSAAIMLLSVTVMDVSANQCPKALDFEIKPQTGTLWSIENDC